MEDKKRFFDVVTTLFLLLVIIVLLVGLTSCRRFKFWGMEIAEDPNTVTVTIDKDAK